MTERRTEPGRRRHFLLRRPRPSQVVRVAVERLEGRELLATLNPITNKTVGARVSLQVALDGGMGNPQTFTATSSNPDIGVSLAQGSFLTIGVSHASSGANDPAFTGTLVFQLFEDLTPNTVAMIEQLVNTGFYTSPTQPASGTPLPSKNFHRIVTDFVAQGGSLSGDGTGDLDAPGFPFPDEFNTQLVFNGIHQLAMANAGDDTNDTQFFVTYAQPRNLDFNHTIFGQLVSGIDTLLQMENVAKQSGGEGTVPVSPILITSSSLSSTNPNGVLHINVTNAAIGDTTTITVTATDSVNSSTTTQSFRVSVTANVDSSGQIVNEPPFLNPVANQVVATNQVAIFQIVGTDVEPDDVLSYRVAGGVSGTGTSKTFTPVQNATATVDANGVVTVTPNTNFTGVINLLVGVRDDKTHAGRPTDLNNPDNYDTQAITLTVRNGEVVNLPPIASSTTVSVPGNQSSVVQLTGITANPASSTQTLTFNLLSQPSHGSISAFDPATGQLTYTPAANFQGTDTIQFQVTDTGAPAPSLTSQPATLTIQVGGLTTGLVRLLDGVLIVTAPERVDRGTNEILVNLSGDTIRVQINGEFDQLQPTLDEVDRVVVYGSKANDRIVVSPDIDLPTTLNGGRGGRNRLVAGSGQARLHGWFGQNILRGGPNRDALIGREGHAIFRQPDRSDQLFLGQGALARRKSFVTYPTADFDVRPSAPPRGQFYRFVNDQIVPIAAPKLRLRRIDVTRIGVNTTPRT